jgi:putative ABC transport system permease protein
MAFLLLVIKSAFRNRLRSSLTAVGVAIAIVAFLFLRTIIGAWNAGADNAAVDRMVVRNRISIIFPMPLSYLPKVKGVPGVTDVSWANWFGGVYKDERNFFARFAVDADTYLTVYPELSITPQEKQAWREDRTGAVVGVKLAEKYGWKIGDQIALAGDIYPGDWKFTVRGIYHSSSKAFDERTMFFHWKYLNEQMPETRKDQLGVLMFRVAPGASSAQVASTIDKMFENSPAETRTETEKAFQMSFLSMMSAVLTAIEIVSGVVLAILMLILANTMAMATRERTTEYAVLRAIGFRPAHVVVMVLGEGLVIASLGAALGLALTPPILEVTARALQQNMGNFLDNDQLALGPAVMAVAVAVLGGMLASAAPAWRAGRLKLVDALRRVE